MRARFVTTSIGMLAMSVCVAGAGWAQDAESLAQQAVELFDELIACSAEPGFAEAGLGAAGPCAEWLERIEAAQAQDGVLIGEGYFCLAGDVRLAGSSLVSGDEGHFNFVAELVDECREQISGSG